MTLNAGNHCLISAEDPSCCGDDVYWTCSWQNQVGGCPQQPETSGSPSKMHCFAILILAV